ncbi:MAG TPA: TIGR03067 domain-containing protein [Gemmataceae bacterium]|nr:TIGR03067 domain-containing protein [Gemmataceae bacterium]
MPRLLLALLIPLVILPQSLAQEHGTLPPGPPPGPEWGTAWLRDALLVQANMIEGGQVLLSVPHLDDANPKEPLPPGRLVKVDGKAVRAFGTDRKPLSMDELNRRLAVRAAAVVVHSEPPDLFFLKALNEHTVVFVVTKKLYDQFAKGAGEDMLPGFWVIQKPGETGHMPTNQYWLMESGKIKVLVSEKKVEGRMTYKADGTDFPKIIDLTPDYGAAKGKTLKGIYELDGNKLKICHVSPDAENPEKAERPKEFGAMGTVTIIFRRMAP